MVENNVRIHASNYNCELGVTRTCGVEQESGTLFVSYEAGRPFVVNTISTAADNQMLVCG